ncbi:hypothetical protein TNCV_3122821 [Trichonephila clavipes]|nr:hypothetical protein TNCV_3122821 [Trichonephila clavipes]
MKEHTGHRLHPDNWLLSLYWDERRGNQFGHYLISLSNHDTSTTVAEYFVSLRLSFQEPPDPYPLGIIAYTE